MVRASGGKPLSDRLQLVPELAHKEVTVLNFAQGGFKQPQQLQALNFFLTLGQRFD
jgi:hypothetical protein